MRATSSLAFNYIRGDAENLGPCCRHSKQLMAALLLEMIEERGGEDWSQVKERQVRGSKERLDDTDIQCMKRWGLANTFR